MAPVHRFVSRTQTRSSLTVPPYYLGYTTSRLYCGSSLTPTTPKVSLTLTLHGPHARCAGCPTCRLASTSYRLVWTRVGHQGGEWRRAGEDLDLTGGRFGGEPLGPRQVAVATWQGRQALPQYRGDRMKAGGGQLDAFAMPTPGRVYTVRPRNAADFSQ